MRDTVELTKKWLFIPDPAGEGFKAGYHSPELNALGWRRTAIPSSVHDYPGLGGYEGIAWYRYDLEIPESWKRRRIVLRTEAINYRSTIWINGHKVGGDSDGFLRTDHNITDVVEPGRSNLLTIACDGTRHPEDVPGLQRGWKPYPGIIRPVYLICMGQTHFDDVWATAEPGDAGSGSIRVSFRMTNSGDDPETVRVRISLKNPQGKALTDADLNPETMEPGQVTSGSWEAEVPGIVAWTPDTPELYGLTLEILGADGEVLDTDSMRVGFRRIETVANKEGRNMLLLNGQPILLTGFNRHEDTQGKGMCPDIEAVKRDVQDMKALGCNFIRLCHYPHDPGELDIYDSAGMLVMAEIPLYWWSGLAEGHQNHRKRLETAKRQLRRLIMRDRNHPCIILWSVSNENSDDQPGVNEGNQELINHAKGLDPTRLSTRVSNHWTKDTAFDSDDVICVNAYPSWEGRIWKCDAGYPLTDSGTWWRKELNKLHAKNPDKPIIVTEFGYPGVQGIQSSSIGEAQQSKAIQAEFTGFRDLPFLAGVVVWCYADHPWPEEDFIKQMTTSPFGVVGRDRRPKAAHSAIGRLFREMRGIPVSGSGGHDWSGDNPNADMKWDGVTVPRVPAFPEGFGIRPMHADEGVLWEDIWRDAEPFMPIGRGVFRSQFGDDPVEISERCFFITNDKGAAVGTISAWFDNPRVGRIHWVAIRPPYQGMGLMKPAMAHAMGVLREKHGDGEIVLGTSLGRRAAVKTYLDFGFLPVTDTPEGIKAWKGFQEHVAHPKLHIWLKRHK